MNSPVEKGAVNPSQIIIQRQFVEPGRRVVDPALVFLVAYALTGAAIFIGRNWLKANIERSVEHRFNERIEAVRSELRKNEEEFKAALRTKEVELAALRDGILTGRAQRQALLDQRRVAAVDGLWKGFMALAPFFGISAYMAVIKFEAAAEEAARNPAIRDMFTTLQKAVAGDPDALLKKLDAQAKEQQPFVSPLAWAYYSAYQSIVLHAFIRAKVLQIGLENPGQFFREEPIKKVLKAALPHQSEYIDMYGASGYHYLLEELEKNLLAELQRMLTGADQDAAGVAQATRIMEMVHEATQKGDAELASGASSSAAPRVTAPHT